MKKKRAQAAIELLTTYGWAIIGVLIVIGALAYFDVFDAKRFVSERCDTGSQIQCNGVYINDYGSFELEVKNNYLVPIDIMGVYVKTETAGPYGTYERNLEVYDSIPDTYASILNVLPGNLTRFRLTTPLSNNLRRGSKQELSVKIQFRRSAPGNVGRNCGDPASTMCYNITGKLVSKVQDHADVPPPPNG